MVNVAKVSVRKGKKGKIAGILSILMVLMCILSLCSMTVFAADTAEAEKALHQAVYNSVSDNDYKLNGGGTIKGSGLFTNTTDGKINESNFEKLTSQAQSDFVSDVAKYSEEARDNDSVGTVSTKEVANDTVQNWWKDLQSSKGVGSKFMNVILENTKPDFVTANAIYQPFSGVVGTIMGVIAVVGMGLLGIVLVMDIFYIALPPVRIFVAEEGENGKGAKKAISKLFSNDAIYAVKVAEESDSSDGNKKQALGIYLKRRIFMLILLGICLLYLVQGQIYTFVGWILDLVSGFLGF